jgi:hypothetical protein
LVEVGGGGIVPKRLGIIFAASAVENNHRYIMKLVALYL